MKRRPRALQEMKAKAPEPEVTGDLVGPPNQGRHPQKVFKKGASWRIKKTFAICQKIPSLPIDLD